MTKTPVSTPGADYQPAPGVEEFLLFLLLLLPWYALSVNVLSSLFRSMLKDAFLAKLLPFLFLVPDTSSDGLCA